MTEYCDGSGGISTFPMSYVVAHSNATGKPSRAKARCSRCAYQGVGRVVTTTQGIKLDGPVVVTPRHKRRDS